MICLSRTRSTLSALNIFLIGLAVIIGNTTIYAQNEIDSLWMLEWHSEYDDVLFEWEVLYETLQEDDSGEIDATWAHNNDFSQWDYSIGDHDGTIWRKWPDREDHWEVRSNGNTTTIKTKWLNDVSEWFINYNDEIKVTWRSKNFNDGNTWSLYKSKYGEFEFYTEFIDDPRDWIIYDATSADLPFDVKMACCFIAMYVTTKQFMR